MILKRKSEDRGHVRFPWLDGKYSFSFGSYFDPNWMGFSKLRVINEDIIDEGMGFETHPHRDMEIISFIISGQLEHKDSMGHSRVIGPGEIQVMSAGKGVLHSEFNPSRTQKTHSLQIWVQPNKIGVEPNYDQFTYKEPSEGVVLLADSVGAEQVAKINQDMKLSLGVFEKSAHELSFNAQKHYWIQVIEGEANILDDTFKAGDALGIKEESLLSIIPLKKFKFLLFELP